MLDNLQPLKAPMAHQAQLDRDDESMHDVPRHSPTPASQHCLSLSNRAALLHMSRTEVQRWTLSKIAEHEACILALRSLHNNTAPIHTLPTEVLMLVFSMIRVNRFTGLNPLHVCRRWRDVIYLTPKFWANVLSSMPYHHTIRHDVMAALLQRSNPCQLTIRVVRCKALLDDRIPLASHLHRISSLTVSTMDVEQYLKLYPLLKRRCCPVLGTLTLFISSIGWEEALIRLLDLDAMTNDDLPNLRRLQIPRDFFVYKFALSSLVELDLSHEAVNIYNPQAFLDALRLCSSLQVLRLHQCLPSEAWEPAESDALPLPTLRILDIAEDTAVLISNFLQRISLPPTAFLTLSTLQRALFSDVLPEAHVKRAFLKADWLRLDIDDKITLHTSAADRQQLSVQMSRGTGDGDGLARDLITDASRLVTPYTRTITALELTYIPTHLLSGNKLAPVLHALPHVTSLTLRTLHLPSSAADTLASVFSTLTACVSVPPARPSPKSSSTAVTVPCPSLRELTVVLQSPLTLPPDVAASLLAVLLKRRQVVCARAGVGYTPLAFVLQYQLPARWRVGEGLCGDAGTMRDALARHLGPLTESVQVRLENS
ncbi:hypothetical protein C8Q76DRAFT_734826 [Earliella scabrosa]|nr:hypothetical protein C8Q76DRAFT_734826 [Earliella scabrosa]